MSCSFYTCGENIDGDEEDIPTKACHTAVQYNGDKPHHWCFKEYSLNDSKTGYLSNFYLFRGLDKNRKDTVSASVYPITT